MPFCYQKRNKAFTLLEVAIYLSLFAIIVFIIYPTLDNLVGYLNYWQSYQILVSDFRRISAELQRRALETSQIGLLSSPPGIYFDIGGKNISYYVSSSAIYRERNADKVILTSNDVLANWSILEKENIFQINFQLQDKSGRVFLQATTSLGRLLP